MGGDRVAISGIPGIPSSTMDVAMPATSFKVRITWLFYFLFLYVLKFVQFGNLLLVLIARVFDLINIIITCY